ncbi:hypothetical protein [Conchiformibius steedae]|nr:hypothetical protein [Conchiformibius steedae]
MYVDIPALVVLGRNQVDVLVRDDNDDGKQIWIRLADNVVRGV